MSSLSLLDSTDEGDLRDAVQRVLAAKCDTPTTLRLYEGDRASVAPLWRTLAQDLGLAGMMIPVGLGGGGGSARDAAVVLEELGRTVAPVPFLTSSVVATSLLASSRWSDVALVAQLATGERTVALLSPFSAACAEDATSLTLDPDGRVTGEVRSVAGALEADDFLVPVHTDTGIAILQVAVTDADCHPVVSLDMTRQLADVRLHGVQGASLLDAEHGGPALDRALMLGAALLASEQVGLAAWCLKTTVDYLKVRRQFGRPVGSFQALKHRLADLFVSIETSSAAARHAAAAVAVDDPDAPLATAVAQAFCSDVAVHAAEEAVQLHGGIGMTWEHPAHLYLKRAKSDQIGLGDPGYHRARLADLANLPGPMRRA